MTTTTDIETPTELRRWIAPYGETPSTLPHSGLLLYSNPQRYTNLVTLDQLQHLKCVVILGMPGSGRTTALPKTCTGDNTRRVQLQITASEAPQQERTNLLVETLRQNEVVDGWLEGKGALELVLDDFDLIGSRPTDVDDAFKHLLSLLREGPTDELRLRLSAQLGYWPEHGAKTLIDQLAWETSDVYVGTLAPLTYLQFEQSCRHHGLEPEGVYDTLKAFGLLDLISHLDTLLPLMRLIQANGLEMERAFYAERICRQQLGRIATRLDGAQDPEDMRRYLEAATYMAAGTTLIGRDHFILGTLQDAHTEELNLEPLDEALGEDDPFLPPERRPTANLMMFVGVRSGLCAPLQGGFETWRCRWRHRSLSHWLAYRFAQPRFSSEQLINLLVYDGEVIPSLRGVAGWLLGELEPKAWQTVAATDPETMLLSDVDQRSEAERTLLVQSLLDAYEAGRTDEAIGYGDSVHRQRLGLLNHEGQLHNHNPGNHALRVHVQRAARSARQNTWSPPTFAMLLQMAQDPARRVVYDQRHLLGVVEALLDESTLNHLLDVRDFWERVPDDRFRPITLTKTRRQLYDFLEDQLATRIVNRSHVRIVPEGPRFRLETSTDAHEALEQIEGVCWSNTNDELYTETERREAEIALVIVACFGGHVWSRQARHTSHQRLHTHEQITRELRACFHDVTVCSVNLAWSEGWGDLKQNLTWGGVLENALDAAGVDVVEMWSQGQHTRWFLRGRWPERLREQFGVSEDVLYVATNEEVRKKLTRLAKAEMQQSEHLDQDLLIVASASDDVERQLEMVPGARGQWLAWPVVEDGFMTEMEELLWQGMPGFDVFNRTTVVRGNQMFGREDGLANARRLLLRGESLGVFGLRKVGKTSFVRALTDAWDPGSQNLYTQPQSETQPWPETLVLWHDAQQLLSYDEMSWLRQMSDVFQRRMKHLTGFEDWPTEPSWAHWQDGLKRVLERPDQRVCVVVIDASRG